MIKFLIIDDEPYVCELLKEIIDWNKLGFSLEGVFYTGNDALRFIHKNHIDVIFTDIKMPDITGLDIAKECNIQYPNIKVILISAHRDFSYAQQAISLHVNDYILKPIVYEQLFNCVIKVKKSVEDDQQTKKDFIDSELSLHRQQFFCDFISETAHDKPNLECMFGRLDISLSAIDSAAGVIELNIFDFTTKILNRWNYPQDVLYTAIRQMLPFETDKFYLILIGKIYNRMEFLMLQKDNSLIFDDVFSEFSKNVIPEISQLISSRVEFTVKKKASCLMELHGIMSLRQITSSKIVSIYSQIICGNTEEARLNIDSIFRIYNDNLTELRYFSAELEKVLNKAPVHLDPPSCPFSQMDQKQMKKRLEEYIEIYRNNKNEKEIGNEIITKAIRYIDENYKSEISLEDIASHVALNPQYFCTYFKKKTGESFIDYLIKARIENAKKIIDNNKDIKVSMLYEAVGYKSAPYFYKVFHSYTGMTPSEYKSRLKE